MTRNTILATAVALLALTSFGAVDQAHSGWNGNSAYCHWYKQMAMNTGDEYWWDRWRRCLRGDDWD